MSRRSLWLAFAAVALIAAVAAPACAQALDPAVSVTANAPTSSVREGEQRSVSWVVRNTATAPPVAPPGGNTDGTATLTLQVPAGWSASLAPGDRSFRLAPGASRTVTVIAQAATGLPADGALSLSAAITDGAGRTSPPASAATTLTFVPLPATVIEKDYTRFIVLATITGLVVIGVAAFLAVYLTRASQVALFVDPKQKPITTGTDGIFLVQVENKGKVRREVQLEVDGLPASWYGAFSFPRVQLQPGERSPVPLCIKVPPGAGDGHQVELRLRARPSSRFPWLVHARTNIEAHDRVRIGNPTPPAQQP